MYSPNLRIDKKKCMGLMKTEEKGKGITRSVDPFITTVFKGGLEIIEVTLSQIVN